MESLSILPLNHNDFSAVAELLANTLNDSLLQKLGKPFIEHDFLPHAQQVTGLFNYTCHLNGEIVGYALFSYPEIAIKQLASKLIYQIAKTTLKKALFSPGLFLELISSFRNKSILEKPIPDLHKTIYLVYLAIDSSIQSRGIGSKFLTNCLTELSISDCIVETYSNKARKFYEKNGFRTIGKRKRFFHDCKLLLREAKETTP